MSWWSWPEFWYGVVWGLVGGGLAVVTAYIVAYLWKEVLKR